jgi:hypothetical protein
MFAKAAAYHAQGRNSTTYTTRTDQPRKQRKSRGKAAEKNT